jgi:L-lactate dehydrogenase complex protein LldG
VKDDRELVFGKVRAALAGRAKSAYPEYGAGFAVTAPGRAAATTGADRVALFTERLERVRGRAFTDTSSLAAWLHATGARRGYCDPKLVSLVRPAFGSLVLDTVLDRRRIDDHAFGITRATAAVAETGTLILTDGGTSRRLGSLAPWVHVAVLERSSILATLEDAVVALGDDPNVIWVTGPSKTADIEGILIEGVHGPGEQVALIV